jgi:hypothetical protein
MPHPSLSPLHTDDRRVVANVNDLFQFVVESVNHLPDLPGPQLYPRVAPNATDSIFLPELIAKAEGEPDDRSRPAGTGLSPLTPFSRR